MAGRRLPHKDNVGTYPFGTEHKYQGHTLFYISSGQEQLTENLMATLGGTPSISETIGVGARS